MALTDKLTAIGDAIRDKTGSTDLLTLDAMPTAISGIETGGGSAELPEEAYTITGNCFHRFPYDGWNWFIENYRDKVVTKDITNAEGMFYYSLYLENIPFDINIKPNTTSGNSLSSIFIGCKHLLTPPKIVNPAVSYMDRVFYECIRVREIPSDYFDTWDWSFIKTKGTAYNSKMNSVYEKCYSLRKPSFEYANHAFPNTSYSYSVYYGIFESCYSLDEVIGLPCPYTSTWTSNAFNNSFNKCHRLKNITFALQEDGTPYTQNWKSQTIDLSNNVGYLASANYSNYITDYNSGITIDKMVTDDESYQALKDDPDWFGVYVDVGKNYSRYNHDSAVATINSLPDTSAYLATAGGTNTIKFKGEAGSATDGGAISTLTEEEIAVATAKGWTVTLV